MSAHLSNAPSIIAMTLAILISPADAQTSSTSCTSTSTPPSHQCCWVKRSWELMGKTTSVNAASATACCYYLGSKTQTSGIPGVRCTTTGIATQITWQGQGLRNSIPAELGNLTNLIHLYLYGNQLSGSIPSSLGNLVNLQTLRLDYNQLSGSIPSSLGNLVNLRELHLGMNQLTGSIPSSLGKLTNLQYLVLYNNQLNGSIPTSLGNLVNLESLDLPKNQLSGSIPSSLGNLPNLQRLVLGVNQLSGSIPTELENLVNLRELYLTFNQLSGSIPSSLGNLVNLQYLRLDYNQLSGSIPSSLGNLVNLQYLELDYNQLSGSIPSSLGNLKNLQYLDLRINPGLNGTFTPQCKTTSGINVAVYVSGTKVTICGCAAASNPPATFPPPGTPDACLATSYTGSTLSKRILAFSQVIEGYKYTCNTDSNQNPYADCLNTMAKICNTADSTFVKSNCHTGVNQMFKQMNSDWQAVRRECGQWQWTDEVKTSFTGSFSSENCNSANSNLITNAFYIQNGQRVPVTSGLTESTNVGLWSKVTA